MGPVQNLVQKSFVKFTSSPVIPFCPFCFSLKRRPSSHTFSKAFEMSRKKPLTSLRSLNEMHLLCVMDINWLIQESPGLSPDWLHETNISKKLKLAVIQTWFKKFFANGQQCNQPIIFQVLLTSVFVNRSNFSLIPFRRKFSTCYTRSKYNIERFKNGSATYLHYANTDVIISMN